MKRPAPRLARRYAAGLRKFAARRQERGLERAYELGRVALAQGCGVLDMARLNQQALERLLPATPANDRRRLLKAAEAFFLQSLSPFEATHRGFRETNAALLKRNQELKAQIRERLRAEKARQAGETRLRAILDHSPAAIFLKDPRGRYLHVNRQFERQFRLAPEQVVGRTDRQIFPRQQAALSESHDREVRRGGGPREFEETTRDRDGPHTSLVFKFPLRDARGKIYALCGIATDITERKRAEEALRNLSSKILHAQEEERRRISRELHDEVGQALTAISVSLAALRPNGAAGPANLARKLAATQRLLAGTMDTVHHFAHELRPASLDELGLLPALRSHVKRFAARTGLRIRLRAHPAVESLGGEQKTALFRIAQESLTNVAKHARASRADIIVRPASGGICMEIADNGKSFRAEPRTALRKKQRLGLLGMQERVRLVRGRFSIQPEPGRGTTVRVTIPFSAADGRA